ncbi:unnamed protein product [Diamesa serratosioi]
MSSTKCAICEIDSILKCSGCKNVSYCTKEHQQKHWKEHKIVCKSFTVTSDDIYGRFLKATRNISAESEIFSEFPIVIGPDWNYDNFKSTNIFHCVACFVPIKMLTYKCSRCSWPLCQPDCVGLQNAQLHDLECALLSAGKGPTERKNFQSVREYFRSDAIFALKCLMLQMKLPKQFQKLMNLQSHEKERKGTMNEKESENQIEYLEKNFLKPLKEAEMKSGAIVLKKNNHRIMQQIYGIIETNAMYLSEYNEVAALFAHGCLIEHNCISNCHFAFDKNNGFKLTVRAARDIKNGEHISTTYSNVLWGTQLRRQQLKEMKYFVCNCERCSDPTELGTNFSTLRCLGSEEMPCNGLQMPLNPLSDDTEWACNKCPIKVTNDQVQLLTNQMGGEIDDIISKSPSVHAVESLIEKLSTFLHPNHYHMFGLKHSLVQLYGNHKDSNIKNLKTDILQKKIQYCDELIGIANSLDPFNIRLSIYTAMFLYEKSTTITELKMRKLCEYTSIDTMQYLQLAKVILKKELDSWQARLLNDKIDKAMEHFTI